MRLSSSIDKAKGPDAHDTKVNAEAVARGNEKGLDEVHEAGGLEAWEQMLREMKQRHAGKGSLRYGDGKGDK